MNLLVIPWVDKTISVVACVPFVVEPYHRWVVGHVNFPRAVLGTQLLVILVYALLSLGRSIGFILREDPGYAAYLQEVRWRWFPGIA